MALANFFFVILTSLALTSTAFALDLECRNSEGSPVHVSITNAKAVISKPIGFHKLSELASYKNILTRDNGGLEMYESADRRFSYIGNVVRAKFSDGFEMTLSLRYQYLFLGRVASQKKILVPMLSSTANKAGAL